LENKIEYQVSPEVAEKLALEQLVLHLRSRHLKPWYIPLAVGLLLACLGEIGHTRLGTEGTDYFAARAVQAVVSFAIGCGFGYFALYFVRSRLSGIARDKYNKMGAARKVSWTPEDITILTPVTETKIQWRMMEGITEGKLGIYGISGRQAVFSIPKAALPPGPGGEDLVQTWRGYVRQPPRIA
jgi:hypothetical protein